jgi:transposase
VDMEESGQTLTFGKAVPDQRGIPRFRSIDRSQMLWKAVDVEELIPEDHPARALWDFTGHLDLGRFCETARCVEGHAGQPALHPRLLTSVWLYAYSRGIGSAREVARQCGYEPGLQWLCGMQPINHHSLSDFRVEHGPALEELFTQVLGVLSAEGVITLERVMHDGTRIRAAASANTFRSEQRLQEHLALARQVVEQMSDPSQEADSASRSRSARQRARKERTQRMENALEQMNRLKEERWKYSEQEPRVSTSDPEARIMKRSGGGFEPGYNVQLSTDAAHGIVVGIEVNQSGADSPHLVKAVDRLEAEFGRLPGALVVDGGYTTAENIVALNGRTELIGPLQVASEARRKGALKKRGIGEEFAPEQFVFLSEERACRCPEGKLLHYYKRGDRNAVGTAFVYRAEETDCQNCSKKLLCCPKAVSRTLQRLEENPVISAFRHAMQTPERKQIYRQRSQVAEFPNAWIKEKLGLRRFHVRGLKKVTSETIWTVLTYNIQQWIRLRWRPALALAN